MPKYEINIAEMLDRYVTVEAETKEAAIASVRRKFENGEIVLDKEKDYYSFEICGRKIQENLK